MEPMVVGLVRDRAARAAHAPSGSGLRFDSPTSATTGYVLARDAWGRGYATETLLAMVEFGRSLGLRRLHTICHAEHGASARVLEKGGFTCLGRKVGHTVFPNLGPEPGDVLAWERLL
jgi:RimJ/RimL family protein N-acetyltransferase